MHAMFMFQGGSIVTSMGCMYLKSISLQKKMKFQSLVETRSHGIYHVMVV